MTSASAFLITWLAIGATPQGVVYDFTQAQCPPCRQMDPVVQKLKQQGYAIKKVYPNRNPELFQKYGVNGTPTFVLVVHGKEVMRQSGIMAESQLRRWCMQIPITAPPKQKTKSKEVIVQLDDGKKRNPLTRLLPGGSSRKSAVPSLVRVNQTKNKHIKGLRWPLGGSNKKSDASVELEPSSNASQSSSQASISGRQKNAKPQEFVPRSAPGKPMESSVRIRVRDKSGMSFGSGTIIASKAGESLILTCGHLFRGVNANTLIEVDVFRGKNKPAKRYQGSVVDFDVDADVGLVMIEPRHKLPFAPVSHQFRKVSVGENVVSIGCGYGEKPTAEQIQVTNLNLSVGAETIVCTGVPVQGRSGGGLFDKNGNVVGVCFGRDKEDRRGWYAALKVIHKMLDGANMASVYRVPVPSKIAKELAASTTEKRQPVADAEKASTGVDETSASEAEEFSQILANAGDAEVICIVRGRDGKKRKVVVINQASPSFVRYLTGELSDGILDKGRPQGTGVKASGQTSRRLSQDASGSSDDSDWLDLPASSAPAETEDVFLKDRRRAVQETSNQIRRYRRHKDAN